MITFQGALEQQAYIIALSYLCLLTLQTADQRYFFWILGSRFFKQETRRLAD